MPRVPSRVVVRAEQMTGLGALGAAGAADPVPTKLGGHVCPGQPAVVFITAVKAAIPPPELSTDPNAPRRSSIAIPVRSAGSLGIGNGAKSPCVARLAQVSEHPRERRRQGGRRRGLLERAQSACQHEGPIGVQQPVSVGADADSLPTCEDREDGHALVVEGRSWNAEHVGPSLAGLRIVPLCHRHSADRDGWPAFGVATHVTRLAVPERILAGHYLV